MYQTMVLCYHCLPDYGRLAQARHYNDICSLEPLPSATYEAAPNMTYTHYNKAGHELFYIVPKKRRLR